MKVKILVFIFCVALSALTVKAELVGHWAFDDGASDSSTSSFNGLLIGDASISGGAKIGPGCLYVDGAGDYAEILGQSNSTIPASLPVGSADRTIAFFMKAENGGGSNSTMFSYGNAPGTGTRFDVLLNSSGQLRVEMSGDPSTGYNYYESFSGQWVHVAVTYRAGQVEVFINGSSIGTKTDVQPYINTGGNTGGSPFVLTIGKSFNDGLRHFKGYIDDVRIYNTVLSSAEISNLLLDNSPKVISPGPENGAVGIVPSAQLTWQSVNAEGAVFDINIGTTPACNELVDGFDNASAMNYTPAPGLLMAGTTYYWRVDIWLGGVEYTGSTWSFTTGGKAGSPKPEDGLIHTSPVGSLSWGLDGPDQSSKVYFGTVGDLHFVGDFDEPHVSLTECASVLGLDMLDPATEYQWRIDTFDLSGNPIATGDVWSFTTEEYTWDWPVVIDDFDFYASTSELLDKWSDGSTNGSNAVVTLEPSRGITAFAYDNTTPPYDSSMSCSFAQPRDWTEYGTDEFSFKILGSEGNTADLMYLRVSDGTSSTAIVLDQVDFADDSKWQVINIRLTDLIAEGVDVTGITEVALGCGDGVNPTGSGTIYVNDIELYQHRCLPEFRLLGDLNNDCLVDISDMMSLAADWLLADYTVTALAAEPAGLIAYYQFEDSGMTASDSSGSGHDATIVTQGIADYWNSDGHQGNCLELSGQMSLQLPASIFSTVGDSLTIAFWISGDPDEFGQHVDTVSFAAGPELVPSVKNTWQRVQWQMPAATAYGPQWNHYAVVNDPDASVMKIYHNGVLVSQNSEGAALIDGSQAGQTEIALLPSSNSAVRVDDFCVYNTALSAEAVAYLAVGPQGVVTQPVCPVLTNSDIVNDGVVDLRDFARLAADWMVQSD